MRLLVLVKGRGSATSLRPPLCLAAKPQLSTFCLELTAASFLTGWSSGWHSAPGVWLSPRFNGVLGSMQNVGQAIPSFKATKRMS